ncbi:unnamed protein product [Schistocephalus solidus]|uniref:Reverse transcriptase domain-containing protein n=1 Tax=Schistocephalus solidus TaxID=70667 RepID=A0A183SUQ5_SCHSO|nr:unnamed protein product [Schistocephalus solidus]
MRTYLYTTFVDLEKASNTVNRNGLWKAMQKFDCPERFMHMVHQFHDGITAHATDNRTASEAFAVTNGVKQGYELAPTLFSLMFPASPIELTGTFPTVDICRSQRACLRLQSCSSRTTAPLTP